MIRLLQIEFIKLWNNKASRFLIVAYFGLMTLIALIGLGMVMNRLTNAINQLIMPLITEECS